MTLQGHMDPSNVVVPSITIHQKTYMAPSTVIPPSTAMPPSITIPPQIPMAPLTARHPANGLSSQVTQRTIELDHRSLSVVDFLFCYKSRSLFDLRYPPNIWPTFVPNSCPRKLLLALIAWHAVLHHVLMKHGMSWEIYIILLETSLLKGKTCNVWSLQSSILKRLGTFFYCSG